MGDLLATDDLTRALDGDDRAFARLVSPLRRELHAHCYRMLGSTHDAEDAVQEALLRAWRGLAGLREPGALRSWLYTAATRTCLDAVGARGRRALPVDLGPASPHAVLDDAPLAEVAWLGPLPAHPDDRYEQRESVELAFVAALQHLPGNQRAALLLFEVLGFSAAEIAGALGTSVASVNSALQRARKLLADRVPDRERSPRVDDARVRELVGEFAAALERGDADALLSLLSADVTWSMPPLPHWYRGFAAAADFALRVPLGSCGEWRSAPVVANGRPALALWLRRPGAGEFAAWSINAFEVDGDRLSVITSFVGAEHFTAFGLPHTIAPRSADPH
ncbi:sigma-70 family RNA polymerase sigma factor [Actinokineospora bangkokensis]|uniref:RNA polymerase subunit sigma-70 n=1 Tax=Actinokineospora bangkokensis TaxID=1193682 RepID=A0A1Q9LRK0_9PSEU|nr:sigma-70 family RNA polymerase sigma factor [Actinokineospora bangkokensis]OLR94655.1 RNA polymerase subunit sigma-70 [Actinokineospora bangkokensis]